MTDSGDDPLSGNPNPAGWDLTKCDRTTWAYDDPSGLLVSKTDAKGRSVNYTYNVRGQTKTRTWARLKPGSTTERVTTTYTYSGDAAGELLTGELKLVSYNDGTPTVSYAYTRLGQLDSLTDATGFRDFIYDDAHLNRLATEALDTFFYAGRMLSRLYGGAAGSFGPYTNGLVAGRPAGFTLGVPTNPERDLRQDYTYADTGRFVGVTSRAVASAARPFTYDYATGTAMVSGYATGSFAVSREFGDPRNLATRVRAKWGSTVITQFDLNANALGQTTTAQQSGTAFKDYLDSSTTGPYNYYAYNARGELKTAVMAKGALPTGTATPASTDQLPGRRFEYRYDQAGNRLVSGAVSPEDESARAAIVDDHYAPNALNQYDTKENNTLRILGNAALNAVVSVSGAAVTRVDRNFAADFVPVSPAATQGTLTISAGVTAGTSYAVKSLTRDYFAPPQTQTLIHDPDGNLVSDGVWAYVYDAENRLIRMTSVLPSGAGFSRRRLECSYDYLGRRVEKKVFDLDVSTTVPTIDHRYLYDGWALIAEKTATGAITRSYTWGLDMAGSLAATGGVGALLQVTNHNINGSTTAFFPSVDGNGNITSLTRDDGLLAAVYEYSPFGEALRAEKFDPAVGDQPFRFSSKFTDDETGLIYYGARYYSPSLGRFINRDPIEEAGGLNLYGFCGNDGVNCVDYLGLAQGKKVRLKGKGTRVGEQVTYATEGGGTLVVNDGGTALYKASDTEIWTLYSVGGSSGAPNSGLQQAQAVAAQLGWNGFTSNLSESQQLYYGKTAADILALQAQGKDVTRLWQAVVNEVPGVITDSGGLMMSSGADAARANFLKATVVAGATGVALGAIISTRVPNAIMPELNSASIQATLSQNGWSTVGSGVSKNGSFVRMQSGSTSITFYTSTSGGGVPSAEVFQNGQPTLKIRLGGGTPPAPNGKGGNP